MSGPQINCATAMPAKNAVSVWTMLVDAGSRPNDTRISPNAGSMASMASAISPIAAETKVRSSRVPIVRRCVELGECGGIA